MNWKQQVCGEANHFFENSNDFRKTENPKKQAASIGDDIKIYEKRPKKSRN